MSDMNENHLRYAGQLEIVRIISASHENLSGLVSFYKVYGSNLIAGLRRDYRIWVSNNLLRKNIVEF